MQAEDGKQEIYVEWPYGNFCKVCKMEKYKKIKTKEILIKFCWLISQNGLFKFGMWPPVCGG